MYAAAFDSGAQERIYLGLPVWEHATLQVYAELEETSRNVILAAMLNRALRASEGLVEDPGFKGLVRLLQLPAAWSFAS